MSVKVSPVDTADDATSTSFTITSDWHRYSSLLRLTWEALAPKRGASSLRIVDPKMYMRASNELITLALIVCWTITLIVDPSQIIEHPGHSFTGDYNPCFGWDYPPASYFAIAFSAVDAHLGFQYASHEALRTRLLDIDGHTSWAEHFALTTAYLHAVSCVAWLLLWSFGPHNNAWGAHLVIFTVCVLFRYATALGNYVESRWSSNAQARKRVQLKHTVFIAVYGVVVATLPTLYLTDLIIYRMEGRTGIDPPLPPALLFVTDGLWIVCVAVSSRLSVPEPPLRITTKCLEFGEEFEVSKEEVRRLRMGPANAMRRQMNESHVKYDAN